MQIFGAEQGKNKRQPVVVTFLFLCVDLRTLYDYVPIFISLSSINHSFACYVREKETFLYIEEPVHVYS